jgi:hypothetical protein
MSRTFSTSMRVSDFIHIVLKPVSAGALRLGLFLLDLRGIDLPSRPDNDQGGSYSRTQARVIDDALRAHGSTSLRRCDSRDSSA